jgi:hypothetical protein
VREWPTAERGYLRGDPDRAERRYWLDAVARAG